MLLSKPVMIGGAVALAAGLLLLTSGTSHAAVEPSPPGPWLPPVPRPDDLPLPPEPVYPTGPTGPVVIPEVTVYGDPAAVAFAASTKAQASAAESAIQSGEGAGCTYSPSVHAFQAAYNQDPTSQHPENVLGDASHIVYALKEDGKAGQQTMTAIWYVTGGLHPSLCG